MKSFLSVVLSAALVVPVPVWGMAAPDPVGGMPRIPGLGAAASNGASAALPGGGQAFLRNPAGGLALAPMQRLVSGWIDVAAAKSEEEKAAAVGALLQNAELRETLLQLRTTPELSSEFRSSRLGEIFRILGPEKAEADYLQSLANDLDREFKRYQGSSIAELGDAPIAPQAVEAVSRFFQNLFIQVNFAKTAPIALLSDPEVGYSDSMVGRLNRVTIQNMYNLMPLHYRLKMLRPYIALSNDVADVPALFILVQHSGPAVQKLMQLFSREVKSAEIRIGLARLQDDLGTPIPLEQREAMVREEFEGSIEDLFVSMSPEPVASATLGVVHQAVWADPKTGIHEKLAVKFLRPGIEEALAEEIEVLHRSVDTDFGRNSINMLERTFVVQTDFRVEGQGIREYAPGYVHSKLGLSAVQSPGNFPNEGVSRTVLVTRWIDGTTLNSFKSDKVKDWETVLKRLLAQYKVWFERALIGDGKMHGDPHGGNDQIDAAKDFLLSLMDFGSVGQLSPEQQDGFYGFILGLQLNRAGMIVKALGQLRHAALGAATETALTMAMKKKLAENKDRPFDERMEDALAVGMEVPQEMPNEIYLFHRGIRMFRSTIREVLSKIEQLGGKQQRAGWVAEFLQKDIAEAVEVRVIAERTAKGSRVVAAKKKKIPGHR